MASTMAEIACFSGKPAAFKRAPLKMFRCEPCDDNCGNAWYRIWTCRNDGWACSDVSLDMGRRMMDQLAERYQIDDKAGLYTGRTFHVERWPCKLA